MRGFQKLALFVSALLPFASGLPQAIKTPIADPEPSEVIPNQYIITLKDTITNLDSHLTWVHRIHARSLGRRELGLAGVEETYNIPNFKGYAGAFDNDIIAEIKANPQVEAVEPDLFLYPSAVTTQPKVPSWGLSAISSKKGGDGTLSGGTYTFDDRAGDGTFAYILDIGINERYTEFGKRIIDKHNVFTDDTRVHEVTDLSGHGTHVAGILAGTTYGVAKNASIIPIKIFPDPDRLQPNKPIFSPISVVLSGYEWAVTDIIKNKRANVSVINMSLGSRPNNRSQVVHQSAAWNAAIASARNLNILTVVAAGNEYINAARVVPANSPHAFTVGATDTNNNFASFSNYGKSLNMLAPGVQIKSAWIGGPRAWTVLDGTSMATPHVSGQALNMMAMGIRGPETITKGLIAVSKRNLITRGAKAWLAGTKNRFLYNNGGLPFPPTPATTK